jgi:very-short-patch-repair endonuclease
MGAAPVAAVQPQTEGRVMSSVDYFDRLFSGEGSMKAELERLSNLCESPIEESLGAALLIADWPHCYGRPKLHIASNGEFRDRDRTPIDRLLVPQFLFEVQDEALRIDFLFRQSATVRVFIECDGHDFHERTKEQATRDRRRDRLIQYEGIALLRFTGTEITRDREACANEILRFVDSLADLEAKEKRNKLNAALPLTLVPKREFIGKP